MTNQTARPRRVLVATDLSARSDRALERAVQLTREWGAELVATFVMTPASMPDFIPMWIDRKDEEMVRYAHGQLLADLADIEVEAKALVVQGDDVAQAIRKAALDEQCDVIVTGMAHSDQPTLMLLGSTVLALSRSVRQPLFVVRGRGHRPYRQVLVATDFSEQSRNALLAAVRLFPDRPLALYHSTEMNPELTSKPDVEIANIRDGECARFIEESGLPEEVRGRMRVIIEHGYLEATLSHYIRQHRVDLAVLGSQGRGFVASVLLGSTARSLLRTLPCDKMLVREPWGGEK